MSLLALVGLGLVGCKETPPPTGSCTTPFDRVVTPDEIRGASQIYIAADKFDFLSGDNFVLDDVQLNVTLRGRHKQTEELELSLNGIKVARRDGQPMIDFLDYLAAQDLSQPRFKIHKMFLNGAEPFDRFMARLKKHKGLFKVGLQGRNIHILDAELVFKGTTYEKCEEPPPPPPPPPPVDPAGYAAHLVSVSPAASPTNSQSIAFEFSANLTGGSFYCSLDQSASSLCQSPMVYAGLASGSHTFQVYGQTPLGEMAGAPDSYSWTIDAQAPTVIITNAADLPTLSNQSHISFSFSADEASQFSCRLDDGLALPCSSPASYDVLVEGLHTFYVQAIDNVGNASGETSFQWTLDLTAPTTTLLSVEPAEAISNINQKTFTFAASESANLECSVDNGGFVGCTSPLTLSNLSEGNHWFEVRAADLAGNQGPSSTYAWKIDLTRPQLNLGLVTPAPGVTNSANIAVEFNTNEPASVFCAFDGEPAAECNSPYSRTMAEGSHQLVLYAEDAAGNLSDSIALSWTMDFTPPQMSFGEILPANVENFNVSEISIAVIASEDMILQPSLNGQPLGVSTSPFLLTGLSEGDYVFSVSGVDSAGNMAEPLSFAFHVDLTAPSISMSSDDQANPTVLDHRSFSLVASEPVTYSCNLDEIGFAACQSPVELSGLADGQHQLVVEARDAAGNLATATGTWVVDTLAPLTSASLTQDSTSVLIQLSASESNVTYFCSLDNAPMSACSDNLDYSNLAVGTHSLLARAQDEAGNLDSVGVIVNFEITPPVATTIISVMPSASLTNINSITFNFSANQTVSGFLCSLDSGTATSCVSGVNYVGLSDGGHSFTVQAIDRFGTVESGGATYNWSIDTVAPSTQESHVRSSNSITFTLTSDDGSALFKCSLNSATMTDCSSPVVYSGLAPGDYVFMAKAYDSAGNVDAAGASFSFTIYPAIQTSITSSTPSAALVNVTSISFTYTANQAASNYLCSLDGAPATDCPSGISYANLADGSHSFLVKAVDQFGFVDETGATHNWTVDTVVPAPANIAFSNVTTNSFTVTWTTAEPATSQVIFGVGTALNQSTVESSAYSTNHSVTVTALSTNTLYSVQVKGRDQAGNVGQSSTKTVRTSR